MELHKVAYKRESIYRDFLEIEEKFKIINWLRNQRTEHDESFQKMSRSEQSRMISLNYSIGDLIRKLEFEINEIAKENGNSYQDENGYMIWVKPN